MGWSSFKEKERLWDEDTASVSQLSETAHWESSFSEMSVTKCQLTLSDHPRRTKTIDGIAESFWVTEFRCKNLYIHDQQ